jgi:hypothetical protein
MATAANGGRKSLCLNKTKKELLRTTNLLDSDPAFSWKAVTLVEGFSIASLAIVLIPWVLSGLWAYSE